MNTIIIGYDESEAAERALARAADIAAAFGARLVVVSVSRSSYVPSPVPALEPVGAVVVPTSVGPVTTEMPAPPSDTGPQPPTPEELAEHRLERARMKLAPWQLDAEYVAEVGDPADALLALAEQHDADLIVVGSREHGFLDRLLGRHVDETVARRADRDVLLVHAM